MRGALYVGGYVQQQWTACCAMWKQAVPRLVFETYLKHTLVPHVLLHLQMIQQGTNNVYPEVEGLLLLLGFKTQNAGCCKVSEPAVTAAVAAGIDLGWTVSL